MISKKISIIVPCYNQAHFLNETLTSVLKQTYKNWECLIVNDGSPDNTKEVAKKWILRDERFKYIEKENGGLSSARNAGIKEASGDFFLFLDSDDLLHRKKLEKSIDALQENNFDIIISDFLRLKGNSGKTKRAFCDLKQVDFNFESILFNWDSKFTIPIHCGLFGKDIFEGVRFNEQTKAKEDWLMWVDVFKKKPKVTFVNQPLVYYRIHKKNMSKDSLQMYQNNIIAIKHLLRTLPDDYKEDFLDKILNNSALRSINHLKKVNKYKKIALYLGVALSISVIVSLLLVVL